MDKATRKAVTLIMDELDGDIEISVRQPEPMNRNERRIRQIDTDVAVEERHDERAVLPWWDGGLWAEGRLPIAVLHSTSDGVRDGVYGSGQKGGLVRRALRGLGARDVVELGCVYQAVEGSPSKEQVIADRDLMHSALVASDVRFVLLHGAHALHAWRPDLTLKQYAGRLGLWDRRWWVVPVPQIDGVTTRRSEYTMDDWTRMVGKLIDAYQAPDVFHYVERLCVWKNRDKVCAVSASHWDDDAVPYCEVHWEQGREQLRKAVGREKKVERGMGKLGLFDE